MSKITLSPNVSGTGTLTIAAPNTNTDRTLTLPDATGTLVNTDASGNLLVGTTTNTNSSRIVSNGVIESTTGGVRFPDGTTQTTAAGAIPANLAVGSITVLYNFVRASYNQGTTIPNNAGTGVATAAPAATGSPFAGAQRSGNVTVPGSPANAFNPTTAAITGTWRALSFVSASDFSPCTGFSTAPAFLAVRIA